MFYKLFIQKSIKNMDVEKQKEWLDKMMKIVEDVNLWEDSDKELYLAMQSIKENL